MPVGTGRGGHFVLSPEKRKRCRPVGLNERHLLPHRNIADCEQSTRTGKLSRRHRFLKASFSKCFPSTLKQTLVKGSFSQVVFFLWTRSGSGEFYGKSFSSTFLSNIMPLPHYTYLGSTKGTK